MGSAPFTYLQEHTTQRLLLPNGCVRPIGRHVCSYGALAASATFTTTLADRNHQQPCGGYGSNQHRASCALWPHPWVSGHLSRTHSPVRYIHSPVLAAGHQVAKHHCVLHARQRVECRRHKLAPADLLKPGCHHLSTICGIPAHTSAIVPTINKDLATWHQQP